MTEKAEAHIPWINKKAVFSLILIAIVVVTLFTTVRLNITGSYEGIYLFHGEDGFFSNFRMTSILVRRVDTLPGLILNPGRSTCGMP